MAFFSDRSEAGRQLAAVIYTTLTQNSTPVVPRCIVLALPRGGLPVAAPVAQILDVVMGVLVAKKITLETNTELAMGAVAADGQVVWGMVPSSQVNYGEVDQQLYSKALQQAHSHAQVQWQNFAPYCPPLELEGAIVLLVDDGVATGMTMAAAVKSARSQQPQQVWICSPVAPPDLIPFLQRLADRVIVLATPRPFYSVSRFYKEFPQVSTEEAIEILQQVNGR
jgi:predicted phosphoribosyltransferase